MATETLSETQVAQALEELPRWSYVDGTIRRELRFKDFSQAFAFMAQGALLSERLNHHPDWRNVYNKVFINLSTHDAGGITRKDIEWAKSVECCVKACGGVEC